MQYMVQLIKQESDGKETNNTTTSTTPISGVDITA